MTVNYNMGTFKIPSSPVSSPAAKVPTPAANPLPTTPKTQPSTPITKLPTSTSLQTSVPAGAQPNPGNGAGQASAVTSNGLGRGQYPAGYTPSGALMTVVQSDLNDAEKNAYDTSAPYYNQLQKYDQGNYNLTNNQATNSYNNNVSSLQNNLDKANWQLNNQEGINGTWASSGRNQRQKWLQNDYTPQFSNLYNNANTELQRSYLNQNYQYGDNGSTAPNSINSYSPFLNQSNSPNYKQSSSSYNPFGFDLGRNEYAHRANAKQTVVSNLNANNQAYPRFFMPNYNYNQ